jgi:hypothetical protein
MWIGKNRPLRLTTVRTTGLSDAGYRAQQEVFCPSYYGDWSKKAKIPGHNGYIETTRLQVLGDHWNSQKANMAELEYLNYSLGISGTSFTIKHLSNKNKLRILSEIFPSDSDLAARTGIAFAPEFMRFKSSDLVKDLLDPISQVKVNAEFTLEGIVQKCGARRLVRRLAALVCGRDLLSVLNDDKTIEFPSSERSDNSTQKVKLNDIDLGSLSLMLGLISPRSEDHPAIFLGTNVAQLLQPYNQVFYRLNKVINIPQTFHLYVINIEAINNIKLTHAKKDNQRGHGLFKCSSDLQERARDFAERI